MEWINDVSGFPEKPRRFFFFFHQEGGNVLGRDQVKRVFAAFDSARNLPGYDEMCADPTYQNGTYAVHGIVDVSTKQTSSDEEAVAALSKETYPGGRPVSRNDIMGYPVADADNMLTSLQSYMLFIEFPEINKAEIALDIILDFCVTSVMSIGLLVGYVMHILMRYYECKGSRRERTVETLRTMSSPVLTGAISTFLGTLPLVFSSSEIFGTVFIAFIGLVLFGTTTCLAVLPILLSVVGPEDPLEEKEDTSHDSS